MTQLVNRDTHDKLKDLWDLIHEHERSDDFVIKSIVRQKTEDFLMDIFQELDEQKELVEDLEFESDNLKEEIADLKGQCEELEQDISECGTNLYNHEILVQELYDKVDKWKYRHKKLNQKHKKLKQRKRKKK